MDDQIKADREAWLHALETATEPQGTQFLGNAELGYCCLGLGCVVLGVPHEPMDSVSLDFKDRVGLRRVNGAPLSGARNMALTDLNDKSRLSFADIAAHLRANMSEYFLEETL